MCGVYDSFVVAELSKHVSHMFVHVLVCVGQPRCACALCVPADAPRQLSLQRGGSTNSMSSRSSKGGSESLKPPEAAFRRASWYRSGVLPKAQYVGDTIDGVYEVKDELGSGAYATVFAAKVCVLQCGGVR